jgi:flagellar biosynthesis/type III secretory pathway chaperone
VDTLAALLDELRAVLEEERRTLLAGRPERIDAVTRRKLALAERLERHDALAGAAAPDLAELSALARYNRENSVICGAMLRYLTEAVDRLRQLDLHRSYNPDGSEARRSAKQALGAA